MFLFVGCLAGIIVVSSVVIARRQRRSGDYLDRLQDADNPGSAHIEAMAAALAAGSARSVGGPF